MKPKINWLNHAIEFVVVVIGILFAFQLNQYASQRHDEDIIEAHKKQIHEETLWNQRSIQIAQKSHETTLAKTDTLLRLLLSRGELHKINQLSIELLKLGGLYIRKNAYTNLTETGDLRLMRSLEEKQRIIDLYEYYKWVEAFEEILRQAYLSDFYPYIKENMDLVRAQTQAEEVYFSKKFINSIATYRYSLTNTLKKHEDCLKEINEYLENEDG